MKKAMIIPALTMAAATMAQGSVTEADVTKFTNPYAGLDFGSMYGSSIDFTSPAYFGRHTKETYRSQQKARKNKFKSQKGRK